MIKWRKKGDLGDKYSGVGTNYILTIGVITNSYLTVSSIYYLKTLKQYPFFPFLTYNQNFVLLLYKGVHFTGPTLPRFISST